MEAASDAIKKREEFTNESNKIRAELHENELRLTKREDVIERQAESLQQRENSVRQQQQEIKKRLHNVDLKDKQLSGIIAQQKNQLLKIN